MEHIYAEIEEYKDDPPEIPPRTDTPIGTPRSRHPLHRQRAPESPLAPDYPPYSSVQVSRKPSLNIDGGLPRFHQGDSLVFSTNLSSSSSDAMF